MTWFELVKSAELKEFEGLATKYADATDLQHLDYLRKKHGKRSNEFYDVLKKQVEGYLTEKKEWATIQDIIKSLRKQNPGLKDETGNLEIFLRRRLEKMDVQTKQERAVGRTGRKTFYKV